MKKLISIFLAFLLLFGAVIVVPVTAADAGEATSVASGWNGTTQTKPEGSGTEEDPYRIANAENLMWVSKSHGGGQGGGTVDPFEGKYLLQTADIDLNGKEMPSIGYYGNGNFSAYRVFGGTYDGNGYTIKNGTIVAANPGHALNAYWGCGLFGYICGATIKNVTLDQTLTVEGNGMTGALVGIAKGSGEKGNVIENCRIAALTLEVTNPTDGNSGKPITTSQRYLAAGGLIGLCFNTVIRHCTVSAELTAPGNFGTLGGIAGLAGANTTIDHCVFTGSITWDCNTVKNTVLAGMGGIVGTVHCADVNAGNTSNVGFLKITDCYNSGSFRAIGFSATTAVSWGGILGLTSKVYPVTATTDDPYPCLIENCYNLADVKWEDMGLSSAGDTYRFAAGILGNSWHNANGLGNWSPIYLKNCTSVNLTQYHVAHGGMEYSYNGAKNKEGKWSAEVLDNSVPNIADRNTEEIREKTAGIDAVIANAQAQIKTLKLKGYQSFQQEGDHTLRLIFGVDHVELFQQYGFDITAEGSENTISQTGTTVYQSVMGYDESGAEIEYTADSMSADYLVPLTLKNLNDGTYIIQSYAVESKNGAKVTGDSVRLVYENGKAAFYPLRQFTISGTSLSDCSIVVPENGAAEKLIAETLRDYLADTFGYRLAVITDQQPATGTEIRIGETARTVVAPGKDRYTIQVTNAALEAVSDTVMGCGNIIDVLMAEVFPYVPENAALTVGQKWEGTETNDQSPSNRGQLRVMYHNVLGYTLEPYPVANRSDMTLQVYRDYMPDVLGLQEASGAWRTASGALLEWLSDAGYQEVCFSAEGGTGNPIFYRSDLLELRESGYKRKRVSDKGVTWCVFEVKDTGELFAVTNAHFSANSNANNDPVLGNQYRTEDAQIMLSVVNGIEAKYAGIPVISGGDFNSRETTDAFAVLSDGGLKSARICAQFVSNHSACNGYPTFNANKNSYELAEFRSPSVADAIDHVMLNNAASGLSVLRYVVLKDRISCTLSDHLPHYIDFDLS